MIAFETKSHFEQLIIAIESSGPVSAEEKKLIAGAFTEKNVERRDFLLKPGIVSNHLYFIAEGCLRVYFTLEHKEIITQFGIKGWCVNDLASFVKATPATQYIQAIEKSKVLQINRRELDNLCNAIPTMNNFMKVKFQNALSSAQEQQVNSLTLSAWDRYQRFRNKYREIEQRVPQYMVASYLGISKEFLSHLRSKN